MDGDVSRLTLNYRLEKIEKLEGEIIRKSGASLRPGSGISPSTMFFIGATQRTLAQARGFRDLISSRNFPCAAALLRMQIDTAMRVNGLLLVDDMEATCEAVLNGQRFSKMKDRSGNNLKDFYLVEKICKDYPWIKEIYEQTSDFVHLSGRHFYTTITATNDTTKTAYLYVSGVDVPRSEEVYHEIVDEFFKVTKVVGTMLLGYFASRLRIAEAAKADDM